MFTFQYNKSGLGYFLSSGNFWTSCLKNSVPLAEFPNTFNGGEYTTIPPTLGITAIITPAWLLFAGNPTVACLKVEISDQFLNHFILNIELNYEHTSP